MSAALAARFAAEFGREPDGIWSAPGRVNLIGEHVDYAGGLCLPLALRIRTVVAAASRDDDTAASRDDKTAASRDGGVLRLRSLRPDAAPWEGSVGDIRPGNPDGWAAYPAGVVWALRRAGYPVGGLDLLVGDSVPPGAGLASSAALECAVALAADARYGLGLAAHHEGRVALAELCRHAENEIVGAPTGGMDQAAALCAEPGHALLLDCDGGGMRQVPLGLDATGLALLVIDTRAAHRLVEGEYAARRRSVEQAAAALGLRSLRDAAPADPDRLADPLLRRRARHVVSEIARVRATVELIDGGRLREIGPLLDASHVSLRDDAEVSSPELDSVVEAARAAGALGARMTGGGFGGSALALVPRDAAPAVTEAVRDAAARHGHPRPVTYEVGG